MGFYDLSSYFYNFGSTRLYRKEREREREKGKKTGRELRKEGSYL